MNEKVTGGFKMTGFTNAYYRSSGPADAKIPAAGERIPVEKWRDPTNLVVKFTSNCFVNIGKITMEEEGCDVKANAFE